MLAAKAIVRMMCDSAPPWQSQRFMCVSDRLSCFRRTFTWASILLSFLSIGTMLASEPQGFDRTMPVAGPVSLQISTGRGGIKITEGREDRIRIHAVLRPLYGRLDMGLAEESIRALLKNPPIEQIGNHIQIGYAHLEYLRAVTMTVEVEIPKASQVYAQTTSGAITIRGPFKPVAATTFSGHTEIEGTTGKVLATSHSGGIFIREAGPGVSVRTESGGIQLATLGGGLKVESRSGRIEVSDVSGDVHATTYRGSISLDNVSGSITARNTSGSIDAFQLAGPVHAETKSGAIHIAQNRPAPIRALLNPA